MIAKTKFAKIKLTEDTLILKNIFTRKIIHLTDIKSIYITNFNELNILTVDNKYIRKKYAFLNKLNKDILQQIVHSIECNEIIVGTDYYKNSSIYSFIPLVIILTNGSIFFYIYLALISLIHFYRKIFESFYIYDLNSGSISVTKRNKLIGLIPFDDCKYKKLVNYDMYYNYTYQKQQIFFNRNITYPAAYSCFIKPKC